jgi:RHS repeat-associated protein
LNCDRAEIPSILKPGTVLYAGQYFDAETGLSYNYFRDYDPAIGRYVESDPIGLRAGTNTYSYVSSNPVLKVDPTGQYENCAYRSVGLAGGGRGIPGVCDSKLIGLVQNAKGQQFSLYLVGKGTYVVYNPTNGITVAVEPIGEGCLMPLGLVDLGYNPCCDYRNAH